MKKILSLLIIVLCVALAACGTGTEEPGYDNPATGNTATEDSGTGTVTEDFGTGTVISDTVESDTKEDAETEDDSIKVEKTIDAVAEALGLTGGKKNYYDVIGAIDGKEYNGGKVELYLYDEASEKYQNILAGNGSSRIAAYKDGMVLLFPVGSTKDTALVEIFNKLVFE